MADDQPTEGGAAQAEPNQPQTNDTHRIQVRRSPDETEINVQDVHRVTGTDEADQLAAAAGAVLPPGGQAASSQQPAAPPAGRTAIGEQQSAQPARPHSGSAGTPPVGGQTPADLSQPTEPNLNESINPTRQPAAGQPSKESPAAADGKSPTGASAKGVTESQSATAARVERAQASAAERLQQGTAQLAARFRSRGRAVGTLLKALLKNPATWEIIIVTVIAIIAIIIAVYLITCTAKGICTGTGQAVNTNAVTNRDDILINLAKQGNREAKLEYLRDHQQAIILALGQQKAGEPDAAKKEIIQKLIAAIGGLKPGVNYADPKLSDADKQAREAALSAYAAYVKMGGAYPEVSAYLNFANEHGAAYQSVGDTFLAGRGSRYHLGYDIFAPANTAVVAGWSGTIESIGDYDADYAAPGALGQFVAIIAEVGGERYRMFYGHITVDQSMKVGQTVSAGDRLGVISPKLRNPHVDIKWKRLSDRQWVDWGRAPFKTVSELTQGTP